jgi:hypothetical protein
MEVPAGSAVSYFHVEHAVEGSTWKHPVRVGRLRATHPLIGFSWPASLQSPTRKVV